MIVDSLKRRGIADYLIRKVEVYLSERDFGREGIRDDPRGFTVVGRRADAGECFVRRYAQMSTHGAVLSGCLCGRPSLSGTSRESRWLKMASGRLPANPETVIIRVPKRKMGWSSKW